MPTEDASADLVTVDLSVDILQDVSADMVFVDTSANVVTGNASAELAAE